MNRIVHILLALIAAVLLFGCAPGRQWTRGDTVRQGIFTAIELLDWSQSRRIARETIASYHVDYPDGSSVTVNGGNYRWTEFNPILGDHPTAREVDLYFSGMIVSNAAVAYLLPPDWRAPWQYISIGMGTVTVGFNFGNGVGMGR